MNASQKPPSRLSSPAGTRSAPAPGNPAAPEEVAQAVLWLQLPASSSITGQAIAAAGGEVMAG